MSTGGEGQAGLGERGRGCEPRSGSRNGVSGPMSSTAGLPPPAFLLLLLSQGPRSPVSIAMLLAPGGSNLSSRLQCKLREKTEFAVGIVLKPRQALPRQQGSDPAAHAQKQPSLDLKKSFILGSIWHADA